MAEDLFVIVKYLHTPRYLAHALYLRVASVVISITELQVFSYFPFQVTHLRDNRTQVLSLQRRCDKFPPVLTCGVSTGNFVTDE